MLRDYFQNRKEAFVPAARRLLLMALAFWLVHGVLRCLLLFRMDPYGIPFVSKPDWYIFHALALDVQWIVGWTLPWGAFAWFLPLRSKVRKGVIPGYFVFHAIVLVLTLLDQEVFRFLGMHLTFELMNTYKDTSSISMFWDYVRMDQAVPYLQFVVLLLMVPGAYVLYRFLGSRFPELQLKRLRNLAVGVLIFYAVSWLFLNVVWTGRARLRKLAPVTTLVVQEIQKARDIGRIDTVGLGSKVMAYQKIWQTVDGDSLWEFSDPQYPLLRVPRGGTTDVRMQRQRDLEPNIIVIYMESLRGMDVGFLNPDAGHPSATPFLDSLAGHAQAWGRLHTSGLPTVGGLLSSHMSIPMHTKRNLVTELVRISAPSFASVLRDSGYATHYFSAADPAWDNLSPWMRRWYEGVHYDRDRENDSLFWNHAAKYVTDSLARPDRPFLATFMTRSNHYPFNFAPGMPESEKAKPVQERIRYTMNYADRHLAVFLRQLARQPWYGKTYVVILGDHGFPLGENGVSTMSGGAFSNATWIPLVVSGPQLGGAQIRTTSSSQIDIAPTVLGLAGIRAKVPFMGHDLLRGHGSGMALGSHYNFGTIGFEGYRLLAPLASNEAPHLYEESDLRQLHDTYAQQEARAKLLRNMLDTLFAVSDYALETDHLVP